MLKGHAMKDEIFKQKVQKQFEFDEKVASVFDDMISRSVPFYKENLRLIVALVAKLGAQNASICDLGCSSANFLIFFCKTFQCYTPKCNIYARKYCIYKIIIFLLRNLISKKLWNQK